MKSSSWQSLLVWLVVAAGVAIVGTTGSARADGKIAAMGVRSLDGEDELERRLSAALRSGASNIGGYSVSDREQSLEQMSLAYGCEEPDARCLGEIARALSVDNLVYGTVVGSGAGHELTLYLFSLSPAHLDSTVLHGATTAQLAGAAAKETMTALLRRLFGLEAEPAQAAVGKLHVLGPAGATVLVDGKSAGTLDEAGSLRLELAPGKHAVRLGGPGSGPLDEQLALIEPGVEDEVTLRPASGATSDEPPPRGTDDEHPAKSKRSARKIVGWTSVGLAAAFAAATIYSWVRIGNINDDPDYKAYRAAFPRANLPNGVKNVCTHAEKGTLAKLDPAQADLEASANDLCNEAETLQMLQWVFLGGTVLTGGVGTYLLLTDRDEPPTTVQLTPRFDAQSASLAATLRF